MSEDISKVICEFVDHLMPELTPYESALYLLLLRMSLPHENARQVRIGKRTVGERLGKSSRAAAQISFYQVSEVLKGLETKGCIAIGDTTREGTLYTVNEPLSIALVQEKLASAEQPSDQTDYFTDPAKRLELFERDKWTCQYCSEPVTKDNATLDHYVPQCRGGSHTKENLRTSCLLCNSIKSGKTFEEAAASLLTSIQERKKRKEK